MHIRTRKEADGGSGATEEMIEMMHRFDKLSLMPKTKHMRADEYLHSNFDGNTELSVWDGELYLEMHRGTFTTKSNLKAYNRKLESKLRNTEIVSLIRSRNGKKYPADEIRDAYKRFLLNQFHDILPGSHINPVYEDAIADYQAVDKDLDSILSENGDYYFNSLNWKREGVHFIESESGKSVRHGVNGYFAYPAIDSLSSGKIEDRTSGDTSWLKADGNKVSTPYYEIEFGNDGSFASLRDAETGREWVKGGFNKLHLYQDTPGMYDAWDILPNYDEVEYELSVEKPLSLDKADSVSAEFSAVLKTPGGKSTWRSSHAMCSPALSSQIPVQVLPYARLTRTQPGSRQDSKSRHISGRTSLKLMAVSQSSTKENTALVFRKTDSLSAFSDRTSDRISCQISDIMISA